MGNKTVIINEKTAKELRKRMLNEQFHPERTKVLAVKEFLDSMFTRGVSDDIVDGYPAKIKSAQLMSTNGDILKIMSMAELLLMLDDKFNHMISDKKDRREFLKAVIRDWYNDKISPEGVLTVNVINVNKK